MEELIKQAVKGDAESQCQLGLAYYKGDVLERSPEKAFRWWMKAAKQKYVHAMPYFIYCYEQGYGTNLIRKKHSYIVRKRQNME